MPKRATKREKEREKEREKKKEGERLSYAKKEGADILFTFDEHE